MNFSMQMANNNNNNNNNNIAFQSQADGKVKKKSNIHVVPA